MHEYMGTARIWELTCPGHPEEVGRAAAGPAMCCTTAPTRTTPH